MSRIDRVRQSVEDFNARDFAAMGKDYAENMRFSVPNMGLDVEGRDVALQHMRDFVRDTDVQSAVEDVVEHEPFVVCFSRSTGTLDGERMTWQLCQVLRYEGEQIVDNFILGGGNAESV